jgi:MoaA/NifB/PqqE/SkfB family radical SAM enzyme
LPIVQKVLQEGHACGIDHIGFTGGEPTIHPQFPEILKHVSQSGYEFSFVTNGLNFSKIYPLLLRYRPKLQGLTFSLDGAREVTHDRLRGRGSFRQVMRAASLCVVKDLPFTFNMVLTRDNREEVGTMVSLAARLGSGGVRFAHLMESRPTMANQLDLSLEERREVERTIWALQKTAPLPMGMAPGYFHATPFFPCGPLELEEYNLDYRGNLTLCCQLSGLSGTNEGADVMGNLHDMNLMEACTRFRQRVAVYLTDKQTRVKNAALTEEEYFPCVYCVKYMGKAATDGPVAFMSLIEPDGISEKRRTNVHVDTMRSATS